MINEENSLDALTRTYVGRTLAHIEGTNPATGAARHYFHDNLGSSRSVRNADKSLYASFEHTPYGDLYASTGAASSIDRRFTGHTWDPTAHLYYFPYRYYSPDLARWLTRDPLGMIDGPNVYGYASSNLMISMDPFGLWCIKVGERELRRVRENELEDPRYSFVPTFWGLLNYALSSATVTGKAYRSIRVSGTLYLRAYLICSQKDDPCPSTSKRIFGVRFFTLDYSRKHYWTHEVWKETWAYGNPNTGLYYSYYNPWTRRWEDTTLSPEGLPAAIPFL